MHASLSCTNGAGGLSIRPQLSFQLVVHKQPVELIISDVFSRSMRRPGADMVKVVASMEDRILDMFQKRELSPFDRFVDGSTLIHVSSDSQSNLGCLLTCCC